MQRRTFLQLSAAAAAGIPLAACGPGERGSAAPRPQSTPRREGRDSAVLLAYFSRAGENYWRGGRKDLKVGNTKRVARHIERRTRCDVFEIRAVDAYPHDYEKTVARNSREQDEDARPQIVGTLPSLKSFETIILASPIWNVRPPMIMSTFAEAFDFTGKTVLPLTTHAMSGLGNAIEDYRRLCAGARIGPGLAIQGEEVADAGNEIDTWLRRQRLT